MCVLFHYPPFSPPLSGLWYSFLIRLGILNNFNSFYIWPVVFDNTDLSGGGNRIRCLFCFVLFFVRIMEFFVFSFLLFFREKRRDWRGEKHHWWAASWMLPTGNWAWKPGRVPWLVIVIEWQWPFGSWVNHRLGKMFVLLLLK